MPNRYLRLAMIWLLLLATISVVQPYLSAWWFSGDGLRPSGQWQYGRGRTVND